MKLPPTGPTAMRRVSRDIHDMWRTSHTALHLIENDKDILLYHKWYQVALMQYVIHSHMQCLVQSEPRFTIGAILICETQ